MLEMAVLTVRRVVKAGLRLYTNLATHPGEVSEVEPVVENQPEAQRHFTAPVEVAAVQTDKITIAIRTTAKILTITVARDIKALCISACPRSQKWQKV